MATHTDQTPGADETPLELTLAELGLDRTLNRWCIDRLKDIESNLHDQIKALKAERDDRSFLTQPILNAVICADCSEVFHDAGVVEAYEGAVGHTPELVCLECHAEYTDDDASAALLRADPARGPENPDDDDSIADAYTGTTTFTMVSHGIGNRRNEWTPCAIHADGCAAITREVNIPGEHNALEETGMESIEDCDEYINADFGDEWAEDGTGNWHALKIHQCALDADPDYHNRAQRRRMAAWTDGTRPDQADEYDMNLTRRQGAIE